MSVERSIFKEWPFECSACGARKTALQWDYEDSPSCCGQPMATPSGPNRASAVVGDEIDVTIRHGLCNEDGSPRRWRSRAELRREERRRGLVVYGDTPNYAREY